MISSKAGHRLDPLLNRIYGSVFGAKTVDPNIFTIIGLIFAVGSAVLLAGGLFLWSGILLFLSGFFDLMDGALARSRSRVTRFGGFLDSVIDRYSDLGLMVGLAVYFLRNGDWFYLVVSLIALVGTAIIPYAKARAEAASIDCNVGLLERSERTIILLIGILFNVLRPAVIILACLTHLTVIQRILFVRKKLSQDPLGEAPALKHPPVGQDKRL